MTAQMRSFGKADVSAAPRLSLGFTNATLEELVIDASSSHVVTSAAKLRSGDPSLSNGVRMRVHGLVRQEGRDTQPVAMGFDVIYRIPALRNAEVPFLAWTYGATRGRSSQSSARGFVVPVSDANPLSLAVLSNGRSTIDFSVGSERSANKLRRGVYFLAVCPAGTETPDWAFLRAAVPSEGKLPVLRQLTLAGSQPVPFDYIVLSADHA